MPDAVNLNQQPSPEEDRGDDLLARNLSKQARQLMCFTTDPWAKEHIFGPCDRVSPSRFISRLFELAGFQSSYQIESPWALVHQTRSWLSLPQPEFDRLYQPKCLSEADFRIVLTKTERLIREGFPADILRGIYNCLSWRCYHLGIAAEDEPSGYQPKVYEFLQQNGGRINALVDYSCAVCGFDKTPDAELTRLNPAAALEQLNQRIEEEQREFSAEAQELGLDDIDKLIRENAREQVVNRPPGWFGDYCRPGSSIGTHTGRLAKPDFPSTMTLKSLKGLEQLATRVTSDLEKTGSVGSLQQPLGSDDWRSRGVIVFLREMGAGLKYLRELFELPPDLKDLSF